MKRLLYSTLVLGVLIIACRSDKTGPDEIAEEIVELPEDFLAFYEAFHADSVFQMNHIAFPLPGKPASGAFNIELSSFKWTRDGWVLHQRIADDDDTFDRRYTVYSESLISETIFSPTYGYYMERRFGKLSDGWNLIYYADMQEPQNAAQN